MQRIHYHTGRQAGRPASKQAEWREKRKRKPGKSRGKGKLNSEGEGKEDLRWSWTLPSASLALSAWRNAPFKLNPNKPTLAATPLLMVCALSVRTHMVSSSYISRICWLFVLFCFLSHSKKLYHPCYFSCSSFLLFSETWSCYVVHHGLEFTEQPRLTLNFRVLCFSLSTEIIELQTWAIMSNTPLLLFLKWHINTIRLKLISNS